MIALKNGVKIPVLGLGTWLINDASDVVKNAINIGYRHFDTAQAYENEDSVAKGIRNSDIKRDEIFVTSKIRAELKTYEKALFSIDESLKKTKFDYLDLMIIHSPQPWNEVNQSQDRHFKGNIEAYKALENAYKAGKIRAIGVSNFLEEDLQNIIENCEIKPMVNQILTHIANTPLKLINFCKQNDIAVEAYSPIAHGEILNNAKIAQMAQKYGVSISQLCIKYTLQLGLISLPKATSLEHLKENFKLDFTISDSDMQILKNLEKIKDYGKSAYFPVFGGKF